MTRLTRFESKSVHAEFISDIPVCQVSGLPVETYYVLTCLWDVEINSA